MFTALRIPIAAVRRHSRRSSSGSPLSNPLRPFIEQNGVVIADGGFGTALGDEAQQHVLWGSQLLFSKAGHEQIQRVHTEFMDAGADIIGTSSYAASYELFLRSGVFDGMLPGGAISSPKLQQRYTHDVLRASVELAKQARYIFWSDESNQQPPGRLRPLVAASVGPVGETVAYTGATDPATSSHTICDDETSEYYRRKVTSLALAKPDLLAFESLPSMREAMLAIDALREAAPSVPAIVSFLCRSERETAAGDDFAEAVAAASAASEQVVACGLNCTSPCHVEPLLAAARKRVGADVLLIASPNSGALWDASEGKRCWYGDEVALTAEHALEMRRHGANIVGGCCRVTPAQIRAFRDGPAK